MIFIQQANRGYVVTHEGEDTTFLDTKEELVEMLYFIVEQLGEAGSRYDAERITISLEPGDKWHDRGK